MSSLRVRLGGVVLLLVVLATVACSSSKSRVGSALGFSTDIKINFQVSENINPDAQQQPSPLFLRIYELDSPEAFDKADFIDLYENDKRVLGNSLVAQDQLEPFVPGQGRVESRVLKPGTRYVGIYAEFLQYQNAKPKLLVQVTENNVIKNRFNVQISGNSIRLID